MRLRVVRELDWAGRRYKPGDVLVVRENHPRTGGLIKGEHVVYDCSMPHEEDRFGELIRK